ncbi:MAG: NADPH-dependent FMN reductase, partial [uncultured Corynebacteriales bacterium]
GDRADPRRGDRRQHPRGTVRAGGGELVRRPGGRARGHGRRRHRPGRVGPAGAAGRLRRRAGGVGDRPAAPAGRRAGVRHRDAGVQPQLPGVGEDPHRLVLRGVAGQARRLRVVRGPGGRRAGGGAPALGVHRGARHDHPRRHQHPQRPRPLRQRRRAARPRAVRRRRRGPAGPARLVGARSGRGAGEAALQGL